MKCLEKFAFSTICLLVGILPSSSFANLVYVANFEDHPGDISVIDTNSNNLVGNIPVTNSVMFGSPYGLAITNGGLLFASNYYSAPPSYVTVIDTNYPSLSNYTTVATIPLSVSGEYVYPNQIAITPNQQYAYVTSNDHTSTAGYVIQIDTANLEVSNVISFPNTLYGIAITPDGSYAYIASSSGVVYVLDLNVFTYETIMSANFDLLRGIAISPDGNYVYVPSYSNNVSVITTSNNMVSATITDMSFDSPHGVSVTPDGNYIYVTNYDSDTVSVIDALDNTVIDVVTVGHNPHQIAISLDGSLDYVTNGDSGTVSAIDLGNNLVISTIPGGNYPTGIVISPLFYLSGTRPFQRPSNRR